MKWSQKSFLALGLVAGAHAATSTDQLNEVNQAYLDSIEAISQSAGSNTAANLYTPVGFKGAYIGRGYDAQLFDSSPYQESYVRRTQLDGEMNLYVTANPNPFFTLWSTLTFGFDYSTEYASESASQAVYRNDSTIITNDYSRVHNNRDGQREEVGIFEEMIVGADIRTSNVKMLARAGSALWVEMSPLTIFRRDPRRRYAWFFESYEPDLSVKGYHTQKSFNRRSYGGRLTWPRKTFGGGHIDFYDLPLGLNGQFLVGEPVNNFPGQKRAATLNKYGDAEGLNSFSNPGMVFAGRIARRATVGDLELGLNFITYHVSRDIYYDNGGPNNVLNTQAWWRRLTANNLEPKIEEPTAISLDLRGKLSNDYYFMGDLAVSQTKTERMKQVKKNGKFAFSDGGTGSTIKSHPFYANAQADSATLANGNWVYLTEYSEFDPDNYEEGSPVRIADSLALAEGELTPYYDPVFSDFETETSDPAVALYAKLAANTKTPYEVEAVYMDREFDSPWGISQDVVPVKVDHMKLGAGSWGYHSNLAGVNFVVQPEVKGGFLKLTAGVHGQLEAAPDFIRFQHKLIGRDLWKSSNSWSRTDPNVNFDGGRPYSTVANRGRLGEVGENRSRYFNEQQLGGLVGDDQALWEEFVPWKQEHFIEDTVNNVTLLAEVPESQKFSWTAGFDWGKDFGGVLPMFMNLNGEFSLISESMNPTEDLLSGALIMGEPVLGLAENFYLIGVFGYEGWYSPYGARNAKDNRAPETDFSFLGTNFELDAERIDLEYHQFALGLGFDWDFATRAGLHVRYKWARHIDASANDYNDKFQSKIDQIRDDAKDTGYSQAQLDEISKYQEAIVSNDFTAGFLFVETKVWF